MKVITIDGKNINNIDEFHDLISKELGFPNYYGRNLDALSDCLTDYIDQPTTIEWKNFEESEKKFEKNAQKIVDVFNDAENELEDFKVNIHRLRK